MAPDDVKKKKERPRGGKTGKKIFQRLNDGPNRRKEGEKKKKGRFS